MKPPLYLTVIGLPKGQPRPRAFAFHGKARVFDPGTAEGWKNQIAIAFKETAPADFTPFMGPVRLNIIFMFPRPKSHFCKAGLKPNAPALFTSKPDADNAAKAVMDALTTLGTWKDDAQVCNLHVTKQYASGQPGATIGISEDEV
jgi:Holliday junction resolvase RusA-like endonuclease